MATQLAPVAETQVPAQYNPDAERFALMQRKAALFANSPLIPEALRQGGPQQALANCYIGLTMADAMNENPLTVLQNIHIVKGKAGFSAQFMIARANASGVFKGRINWRMSGQGDSLSAEAFAVLAETGDEVSFAVDMAMAKAEGWTSNPKYKSVPHLMLRYRSATFLVRLYAPDVMFGYQTAEEVEDVVYAATTPPTGALTGAMLIEQAKPSDAAIVDEATGEVLAELVTDGANDGTFAVDNPTADEGRADHEHGDQHDGTDDLAADRPTLDQALEYLQSAANIIDLNKRFDEVKGFFEDDGYVAVSDERDACAGRLRRGKGV